MKITVTTLQQRRTAGEKIAMLTCYDASFAALLSAAGVEVLLVGDSLGMVIQGESSTLPVSLEQMVYHTRCVARMAGNALVLADLPFGAYQQSPQQAFDAAAKLMAAGAEMVKLEGGAHMAETTAFLSIRGIPVCAHIGLTPQSVHAMGGYRLQGKSDAAAARLREEAGLLAEAGAAMLLMEMVPAALAGKITAQLSIPTIGIGAGGAVDGQVLVLYDALGIYPGRRARFVKNFMEGAPDIGSAVAAYVTAVKHQTFPQAMHAF